MNVLVVEDDAGIAAFLAKGLRAEGYAVTVAPDGDQALSVVAGLGEDLDLVLLDLNLPGLSGYELLTRWRGSGVAAPIIVLTARDAVVDKVRGLDTGATDYVTKPFAFDELLARIRAALRTAEQVSVTQLAVADLRLDLLAKVAWRDGRRIDLAPREWALLELFMRSPTQVLSRTQILNHVWDYSFEPGSNVVDVYVSYLRRKLNRAGLRTLLQTVRGAGYRLLPPGFEGDGPV
ncbi:MAG: response regulator transcription factor [Acidimicrobiales bacterium]